MFKKTVIVSYGLLATLYVLFLALPLTKYLVNDGGDLIWLWPLVWLTLIASAASVWYFFLKGKQ